MANVTSGSKRSSGARPQPEVAIQPLPPISRMLNRIEDARGVPVGPSWFKVTGVLQLLGLPDDPPGIIGRKLPRPATDQWHQVVPSVALDHEDTRVSNDSYGLILG